MNMMNVGLRKLRNCGLNFFVNHFTAKINIVNSNFNADLKAKNIRCTACKGFIKYYPSRDANPPVFCGRLPFFPSISRLPVLLANLPIFRILKIIIITDPDNRHYGNREKRYNQLITCQLVRFCDKSKLKSVQINSFALKFSPVIHPKS